MTSVVNQVLGQTELWCNKKISVQMEDTRMCRERAVLPVTMRWCRMDRLSYPLFMLIRSGGHRPQQEERQRERARGGCLEGHTD